MRRPSIVLASIMLLANLGVTRAGDADAIARGKKALETRAFIPARWTVDAYDNAWTRWTPKPDQKPRDYDKAFAVYYGLHPAPYPNGRYPMGLRPGTNGEGLVVDCMLCHGGAIFGNSYIGLGNSTFDLHAFYEDMNAGSGVTQKIPFNMTTVRGTNEAFALTDYLLGMRNPDLSVRKESAHGKVCDHLCEDVPAWWLLKKKTTIYRTGSHSAKSVRALMQFMLTPRNSAADIEKEEGVYRDIQAYLLTQEAPKYPFDINKTLAAKGHELFAENCAKCHGTYGPSAKYPNKIVPINTVGTDATRVQNFSSPYFDFYNKTWFAQEKPKGFPSTKTSGYQAPPLDGVWATAPYLHNHSAPTLYNVLNSKSRPKLFTRSYSVAESEYDKVNVGWKVQVLRETPPNLSVREQRKIYDTTQSGRNNGGHTFGDDLSDADRRAVIEYLKTL